MPVYRFAFHGEDERLLGEEHQSFAKDDDAIDFARVLLSERPVVMIWCGERFVRRLSRSRSS
jgi:hypothetical protein